MTPSRSAVVDPLRRRLFGYAGETDVYSAGESHCIVEIGGLSLAVFICFDLRFPELFRDVGRDVDAFVVIANWPSTRQQHWEVLTRARDREPVLHDGGKPRRRRWRLVLQRRLGHLRSVG